MNDQESGAQTALTSMVDMKQLTLVETKKGSKSRKGII